MATPPDRLSHPTRRAVDAMDKDPSGTSKGSNFNAWVRAWASRARVVPGKLLPKKGPVGELNPWKIQAEVDERQNKALEAARERYATRPASPVAPAPSASETEEEERDRARRMQDAVALVARNSNAPDNEREGAIMLAANSLLTVPDRKIDASDFAEVLGALPAGDTPKLVADAVFKLVRHEAGKTNPPAWVTPWTELQAYKDWDVANAQRVVAAPQEDTADIPASTEAQVETGKVVWPADVPIVEQGRPFLTGDESDKKATVEKMTGLDLGELGRTQAEGVRFAVDVFIDARVDLGSDLGEQVISWVKKFPESAQHAFWWNLSARLARYIQKPPAATEKPKTGTEENPERLLVDDQVWLLRQARFIQDHQTKDGEVSTGGLHDAEGLPVALPAEEPQLNFKEPINVEGSQEDLEELAERIIGSLRASGSDATQVTFAGSNTDLTTLGKLLDERQITLKEFRDVKTAADGSMSVTASIALPTASKPGETVSGVPAHEEAAAQKPSFDELLDQIETGQAVNVPEEQASEIADAIIREGQSRAGFEDLRSLSPGLVGLVQEELRVRLLNARAAGKPLKNESDFTDNFELGTLEEATTVTSSQATPSHAVPIPASVVTPEPSSPAPDITSPVTAPPPTATATEEQGLAPSAAAEPAAPDAVTTEQDAEAKIRNKFNNILGTVNDENLSDRLIRFYAEDLVVIARELANRIDLNVLVHPEAAKIPVTNPTRIQAADTIGRQLVEANNADDEITVKELIRTAVYLGLENQPAWGDWLRGVAQNYGIDLSLPE